MARLQNTRPLPFHFKTLQPQSHSHSIIYLFHSSFLMSCNQQMSLYAYHVLKSECFQLGAYLACNDIYHCKRFPDPFNFPS